MVTSDKNQTRELDILLNRAEEFHGHLGPFLTLGVRMGMIGVRELEAKGRSEMRVTAMVKDSPPFSCVLDGIQVVTKCTIGNKKLSLKKSSGVAAKFEVPDVRSAIVTVDPAVLGRLKNKLLTGNVPPEELRKLAHEVASMPEEELFRIRKK